MRLSIRSKIFLAVVLIQLVTVALIVGWYFYTVNAELRGLNRAHAEEAVLKTIEATKDYFGPPESIARITHSLLSGDVLDRTRPDQLERFFLEELRLSPHLSGMFVGYPDGGFHFVSRNDEAGKGGTLTKVISAEAGVRTVNLTWRGPDLAVARTASDPADTYDPRTRSWYKAATERRDLIWTDPYVFFTAREPGITVAIPVIDASGGIEAVIGLDIELSTVSRFLVQLGFQSGGSAYILGPQGDVIAHGRETLVLPGSEGNADTLRLRKAGELPGVEGAVGDRLMAQAAQESGSDMPTVSDEAFEGEDYFVASGGIGDAKWPWRVVAIVPAASIMRSMESGTLLLLGIVLLTTILACFVGYVVALSVGRPLVALHEEAKLARHGNFEVMGAISSGYREIDETDEILRALAKQQRGHAP
jgi:hypothetical protein